MLYSPKFRFRFVKITFGKLEIFSQVDEVCVPFSVEK